MRSLLAFVALVFVIGATPPRCCACDPAGQFRVDIRSYGGFPQRVRVIEDPAVWGYPPPQFAPQGFGYSGYPQFQPQFAPQQFGACPTCPQTAGQFGFGGGFGGGYYAPQQFQPQFAPPQYYGGFNGGFSSTPFSTGPCPGGVCPRR